MSRTAIILAGGKSSRMGTNKALLKIAGQTVIERTANELKKITDQLLIVTNTFEDYEFLQLPMVEDEWKGKGPLAGIHAGLNASNSEHNLIVACDMPFISATLGEYLLNDLNDYQAVIPRLYGQLHPLFGAYRKEVYKEVANALENDRLRIRQFLDEIQVKIVTEEGLKHDNLILKDTDVFNMNDPKEYEKALNLTPKR